MIGAIALLASSVEPNELAGSTTFRFARAAAYILTNVYAMKMAAVFMVSTSTVVIYTGIAPTLDCVYRLPLSARAADRQRLHRVELGGVAGLGPFDQCLYPDRQPAPTAS